VVPQEFKFIKRGSKSLAKAYPLLGPRYVFVGAEGGFPWEARNKVHLITGFVRQEGKPAVFSVDSIKRLDRISKNPYNIPISTSVRHKSLRVGEGVIIKTPPFEDHRAVIVEVKRGRVRVFVSLLGSAQAVWVDMDLVEHE